MEAALEEFDERRDIVPEPHAPAGLLEVFPPNAPELGIVANQVRELAALLDEVAAREASTFCWKPRGADELTEHEPRSLKLSV